MKKVLSRALLFLVLSSVAAEAQDVERFRQFAEVGVFDFEVSADEANEIVRAGIASEDPEIVDLTIRAIGVFSARANWHNIPGVDVEQVELPDRSFSEIGGLKQFLIDYYHKHHAASGYHEASVMLNSMDEVEESEIARDQQERLDQAREDGDWATANSVMIEIFETVAPLVRNEPSWPRVPGILCDYWPGDVDVLNFIWQIDAVDISEFNTAGTLVMLNWGEFKTPDAHAFRMDKLRSAIHSLDEDAFFDAKFAIEGLALAPEREALPLIIEAGLREPMVRSEALLALDRCGDADLAAHRDAIQLLISTRRIEYLEDAEVAAVRRLEALFEIDGPAGLPD